MTDLVVTAANVVAAAGARTQKYNAGAAITAGESVYIDSSGDAQLASHDVDAATAAVVGIALNDAAANQPVNVQVGGDINPGATVAAGTVYVVGSEPGGVAPVVDVGSGDFTSIIGVGTSTSNIKLGVLQAGVAAP